MPIIDFHAHAFPDELAPRAVASLSGKSGVTPALDGTTADLLRSMDRAGIERSVICSIATKPGQFRKIMDWSGRIRSDRLVPLPSVHPDDPELSDHIRALRSEGFAGLKLHPYYQNFILDDPRLDCLYETVRDCGLLLVCHTGFDVAFPRERRCDPARVARVADRFPGLRFVATHLGGWEDWGEVERWLIGRPIVLETSYSLAFAGLDVASRLLLAHPEECILFGTDSPWADQAEELEQVRSLDLPPGRAERLLYGNARRLLAGR